MAMIAALLLFAPFFAFSVAVALAAIGLACAPIAFVALAFYARSKGANPYTTSAIGASYSLLFFVPLVYFILRVTGRKVAPNLVLFTYVFLYFIWMFGIVGVVMVLTIVSETRSGVLIPLMLFMLVTTSVSVWPLLRSGDRGGLGCRISIRHLCPFIIAYLNLLLVFAFVIPPAPLAGML